MIHPFREHAWPRAQNVKFAGTEANAIGQATRDSGLPVLKAWRDLGEQHVAVSEVGVACANVCQRLGFGRSEVDLMLVEFCHGNE